MTSDIALENLLDQMTLALQRGALDTLGPLSVAIAAELARLPALDGPRAEGLRRRARRNDACLQAAARGVRAAIARIAGIGGAGPNLSTYGADGRKVVVGATTAHLTHRL
jgi:hypothetical protein